MEVLLLSLYLSRKCFGRRKATRGVRELDLEALTRAARDAGEVVGRGDLSPPLQDLSHVEAG